MRRHVHSDTADVPGIALPDPFPSRGRWDHTYNPGPFPAKNTIKFSTWKRPDGTLAEQRTYSYNAGPVPPRNTVASVSRVIYDIDGATVIDTLTYTYTYSAAPALVISEVVT